MAKCGYCNSTILIGGVKDGEARFCNQQCQERGVLMAVSNQVPPEQVQEALRQVHQGLCPRCGGSGPIDVSIAHKVWSALVVTSWKSEPQVCCRSCGRKHQAFGLLSSAVVGWWGIPWGLIMTPVQIVRNLAGMFRSYDPYAPSPELENMVRLTIAASLIEQARAEGKA